LLPVIPAVICKLMGKESWHQVTSTFYSVLLYTSGIVRRVSIVHKDRPRTCTGAHAYRTASDSYLSSTLRRVL